MYQIKREIIKEKFNSKCQGKQFRYSTTTSSVKYSKYHNIVCVLLVRTTVDTSVLLFDLDAGLFFIMEYFLCNEPGPRITTEDDLGTRENWKRN